MDPSVADETPSITASVSLTTGHTDFPQCRAPEKMHLSLTLVLDAAVEREITIHNHGTRLTSSNYLWDTFLCIVDPETKDEITLPPSPNYSWHAPGPLSTEQLQALSFPISATSPVRHQILTLEAGEKVTRTVTFESSHLFERYQEALVKGKSYDIKLKPVQRVKRWIWGDLEDTEAPLGWGQISILDTEEAAHFTSDGPTEALKTFPRPNCHVND